MIIPVGDDNVEGGARPFFSYGFILINILVFGYQITLNQNVIIEFFHLYGTVPADILQGQHLYTLFLSMFLHGGLGLLLGNMLYIWMFSVNVDADLLYLYFIFNTVITYYH